jgi:hypothetical protein
LIHGLKVNFGRFKQGALVGQTGFELGFGGK